MRLAIRGNRWLFALGAGSLVGVTMLGAGGRLAMRGVALATARPPAWTIGGTITVLFFGLWIGAAAALIRAALSRWTPARTPEWVRTAIFAIVCLALGLRGVSPFTALTLALFLPVLIAYAATLEVIWRRWERRVAGAAGAMQLHGRSTLAEVP